MKRNIYFAATFFILSSVTFIFVTKRSVPKLQPNEIDVGGVIKQTTGVVVDQDGPESISQMISLIDRGRVDGDGFSFTSSGNGRISIELKRPYEQSKSKALEWLINNGYTAINPESFLYIEIEE